MTSRPPPPPIERATDLARRAADLVGRVPAADVRALAASLLDPALTLGAAVRELSHPPARSAVNDLLRKHPDRRAAAAVLLAAAEVRERGTGGGAEVVWTGPASGIPFRSTEQALLEVVTSATDRLTVVSYAVHRIPRVRTALTDAVARGVRLRIVLETPHLRPADAGASGYDTVRALGLAPDSGRVELLHWPEDRRPADADGRRGILHVKCVLADGRRMFLSSANLTSYALSTNMELGLLVDDTARVGRVEAHFDGLAAGGVLRPLDGH